MNINRRGPGGSYNANVIARIQIHVERVAAEQFQPSHTSTGSGNGQRVSLGRGLPEVNSLAGTANLILPALNNGAYPILPVHFSDHQIPAMRRQSGMR